MVVAVSKRRPRNLGMWTIPVNIVAAVCLEAQTMWRKPAPGDAGASVRINLMV